MHSRRALLRKKNITVQGSNSSYIVLKSGTWSPSRRQQESAASELTISATRS